MNNNAFRRSIIDLLVQVGPRKTGDGQWRFTLWAPHAESVNLELLEKDAGKVELALPMEREGEYWGAIANDISAGQLYRFSLDGRPPRPDPASRSQPLGVHGPSALVDLPPLEGRPFAAPALEDMILYELHVGAFTPEGTLDAAAARLDHLAELGVNAVELMPLAQCPGERNWGYDGTYLFAVQHNYGGAPGLRRFVQACHQRGLAVILDVVYNHLGPEGNYLREFAPYFTRKYSTPWGEAVNFDGPYSDGVRNFVLENARHWLQEHGIDGLRIDAVHAIYDCRPDHILADLSLLAHDLGGELGGELGESRPARPVLIAESHDNDPRLISPVSENGLGMDAVWNDDFHHSVHAFFTGENQGYYGDYGELDQIAKALRAGFSYTGQYSPYRKRRHGLPAGHLPAGRFVNWLQTHDMIGNRLEGDRLATLLDPSSFRLAAALLLLSPGVPMLFMGEEWGETAPFLYFTHHGDEELIENVRKGRIREFKAFDWKGAPPDPQDEETFLRSRLDWGKPDSGPHARLLAFHRELLRLRGRHQALRCQERERTLVAKSNGVLTLDRLDCGETERLLCVFNMADAPRNAHLPPVDDGSGWTLLLHSEAEKWGGSLPEHGETGFMSDSGGFELPARAACLLLAR